RGQEGVERGRLALDFDEDAVGPVPDEALQPPAAGQQAHVGPEADPLDDAADRHGATRHEGPSPDRSPHVRRAVWAWLALRPPALTPVRTTTAWAWLPDPPKSPPALTPVRTVTAAWAWFPDPPISAPALTPVRTAMAA